MKKFWNNRKKDFNRVYEGMCDICKRRLPTWVVGIWYVIMLPFGIILGWIFLLLIKWEVHKYKNVSIKYGWTEETI